jgi:aspartyl-tRNA(Asn)/glutamyl-tRNA(Gln) amidotransferase subunit C
VAKITRREVEHVARLARLELTEEEKVRMTAQLDSILGYVDTLNQVDTSTVEPATTGTPMVSVMREDEVRASLKQEEALANASDREGAFFRVPRIIED